MNPVHWIRLGALLGLAGFTLSGPVAVFIVQMTYPQPEWVSSQVFAEHYHILQTLPYYLGFLLLGGMLILVAGHLFQSFAATGLISPTPVMAMALTTIFAALISFNYICQISFVHNLATHYHSTYDGLIAGFSMSNPLSFCWANEMWGYGILGLATWLMAASYKGVNQVIRFLMITNGMVSLISPIWTIIDPYWVMTALGMGLYLLWNLLMIIMMIAILRHYPSLKNRH